MLVTLLFYFFFVPFALGMAVLEGESYSLSDYRSFMLPFSLSPGPSGLPFSVLISPLSLLFFSFSLVLSASVLVVIPFRTGSFQTTSTRCATLLPVNVGVDHKGMPLDVTQGMADPDNSHISPTFVNDVLNGSKAADVSMLAFRDPDAFMAGNIHANLPSWQGIAAVAPYDSAQEVLKWIEHRVDVHQFFVPFKEITRESLTILISLLIGFSSNSISCKPFVSFISRTILDRLATGAISVWGRVSEVEPPHLVMPLTVEPTKPRLCNDNRFLNPWVKDTPFNLDSISSLPRYVSPSSFQSVCDEQVGL